MQNTATPSDDGEARVDEPESGDRSDRMAGPAPHSNVASPAVEEGPAVEEDPILEEGRNCWRIARADRVGLVVDAANYFTFLREVMIASERELLLIGWDFDFEIEMLPGQSDADGAAPDGLPNQLGAFLKAVVDLKPDLDVYMLKWNGAVVAAPGRFLPSLAIYALTDARVHFALDGHHPFGACHHQKIVVADDSFAFCGGIDVTEDRWDTSEHLPDDPRRIRKDGSPAEPWHDATMAVTGPVAQALGELSRRRWERATGDVLERPRDVDPLDWPDGLEIAVRDVPVAVAQTEPPYDGEALVDEIERLYLDAIAAARTSIYIESQYFTAASICEAIEARLTEEDGPEIVVVNPQAARTGFEDRSMHVLRGRVIDRLRAKDPGGRFGIFHPANVAGEPIYVHAKILIVDDRLLKLGSSNIDDRSLGFDTECDVAIEGTGARAEEVGAVIAAFRARLLAEHLGTTPDAVEAAHRSTGSIIGAIEALNRPEGRGLRAIVRLPEDVIGTWLADTRLMDPRYRPGEPTDTGRGVRPRHLVLGGAAIGLGLLAWLAVRRRARRARD